MPSRRLLPFVLISMASVVQADPITIRITGRVAEVSDFANVLGGAVTPSMPFTAEYTYDSSILDTNTDPTVGDYWNRFPPGAMRIKVGGFTFGSDPANPWVLLEVVNRARDNYLVRSYTNLPVGDLYVEHMAWQLDDPTGQAITGDAMPLTAPVLTQWTSIFGLTVEGWRPSRIGRVPPPGSPPMGDQFFIRGHVDSAVLVPVTASTCAEGFDCALDEAPREQKLPDEPQGIPDTLN